MNRTIGKHESAGGGSSSDNAELLKRNLDDVARKIGNAADWHALLGGIEEFGFWACDAAGNNIYSSQSFLNTIGCSFEDFRRLGWGHFAHPDDREETSLLWRDCVANGEPWSREHRCRGRDGVYRYMLARGNPVRNEAGDIVLWIGFYLDITDYKRNEAAAIESEGRIRALNERLEAESAKATAERERLDMALNVSGMISIWDGDLVDGKVYGDSNFARIYGMDEAEVLEGKPLGHYIEFIHPDDRGETRAAMDRMMRGGDEYAQEHRILRPDGTLLWVLARGRLLRDADGKPIRFLGVSVDITGRKLAEERQAFLVRLQDLMRGLSEPQEILVAAAAHLGRYLGASRVGYGEILPDDETVIVSCGYVDNVPEVNGVFKLADFGVENVARLKQGQSFVHDDVLADNRRDRAVWEKLGTRGHATVPLMRNGRCTGSMYVSYYTPHRWGGEEIALIEEVAARIWDAVERGRAEVRLREAEERMRLALESGQLGSWDYNVLTGEAVRSLKHDQIFGYDREVEDWSFYRFLEHVVPADRARVETSFRAILDSGNDWYLECGICKVNGDEGFIEIRAKLHTDRNGKVVRILGTIADITKRKRAEQAALENAEQFRIFAQAMPNHVWITSADGRFDWFNDRIYAYSGLGKALFDGWELLVHPEDLPGALKLWEGALASGNLFETELRLRRSDGVFRWHIVRAEAIRDADEKIMRWIGTNTDIEDQKFTALALADLNTTLEEQVRERTAELMAAEESLRQSQKMEAVGQLTGGLAHDFNNLLTGILGSLEQVEKRVAQGRTGELDRYLSIAQGAAQRAASLTHRLLAFSRRQTLNPQATDVNRLVSGMGDLIRRAAGPSVSVDITPGAALWPIFVDTNQLENALLNLCINARDAMPDGGLITIETSNLRFDEPAAKEYDLPEGEYVRLCVTDTGLGMPPEIIARAFDPFFTTKPLGEGTGLGLSMVYGFVRQSGGQAAISSEVGRGSSICLYLPRFLGTGEVLEKVAAVKGDHSARRGETVLVVDDEPGIRTLIIEVLTELDYIVIEASDAASGLKILRSRRPVDLLITDIGLPGGMNGWQFGDKARQTRPGLKILFITGYAQNAISGDAELKPDMHILTKPFSLETLTAQVKDILSR